nr:MAG TPA: hypothetical protein [Caudoviricetes sp.]
MGKPLKYQAGSTTRRMSRQSINSSTSSAYLSRKIG